MEIGDVVSFGEYNWRILDVQSSRALILCEEITEVINYHYKQANAPWSHSAMRGHLNDEFFNSFSENDRQRIIPVMNTACHNPLNGTSDRYDTEDRIFLLINIEFGGFFAAERGSNQPASIVRYKKEVKFSRQERKWMKTHYRPDSWWLRTPGCILPSVMVVGKDGFADLVGLDAHLYYCGVRPAMWLKLE